MNPVTAPPPAETATLTPPHTAVRTPRRTPSAAGPELQGGPAPAGPGPVSAVTAPRARTRPRTAAFPSAAPLHGDPAAHADTTAPLAELGGTGR
ncbi:hypothetical protein [Streptomyces ardesiacus]|uniref:hypothetical protein n=1 Tax=Streptomyces ardesiacus TaxID=285564 RepID=UPI002FDBB1AB